MPLPIRATDSTQAEPTQEEPSFAQRWLPAIAGVAAASLPAISAYQAYKRHQIIKSRVEKAPELTLRELNAKARKGDVGLQDLPKTLAEGSLGRLQAGSSYAGGAPLMHAQLYGDTVPAIPGGFKGPSVAHGGANTGGRAGKKLSPAEYKRINDASSLSAHDDATYGTSTAAPVRGVALLRPKQKLTAAEHAAMDEFRQKNHTAPYATVRAPLSGLAETLLPQQLRHAIPEMNVSTQHCGSYPAGAYLAAGRRATPESAAFTLPAHLAASDHFDMLGVTQKQTVLKGMNAAIRGRLIGGGIAAAGTGAAAALATKYLTRTNDDPDEEKTTDGVPQGPPRT